MKKICLLFLYLIINIYFVFSISKEQLNIVLEYECPMNYEFVFSETTTVALQVEEIIADGQLITQFDDIRDLAISEIKYKKNKADKCFINMTWYYYQGYYVWNDGRGIIFSENKDGYYIPKTNSYRIPVNTKKLIIKYKVLFPSDNIDTKKLLETFPNDGDYSSSYIKEITLDKYPPKL